ncbi:hypothetical protein NC651_003353 [Populus alba x Populus x berolinensis]|nr:hypothetical protein NC651_003353 [Populus alba x Populus x berolinensis]
MWTSQNLNGDWRTLDANYWTRGAKPIKTRTTFPFRNIFPQIRLVIRPSTRPLVQMSNLRKRNLSPPSYLVRGQPLPSQCCFLFLQSFEKITLVEIIFEK